MPHPELPIALEVVGIAKALREEGFRAGSIEATPEGGYKVAWAEEKSAQSATPLEHWLVNNGDS